MKQIAVAEIAGIERHGVPNVCTSGVLFKRGERLNLALVQYVKV